MMGGFLYWALLRCSSTSLGVTQMTCCPFQYLTMLRDWRVLMMSVWVMLVIWLGRGRRGGYWEHWEYWGALLESCRTSSRTHDPCWVATGDAGGVTGWLQEVLEGQLVSLGGYQCSWEATGLTGKLWCPPELLDGAVGPEGPLVLQQCP